jgi:hypothetical protein
MNDDGNRGASHIFSAFRRKMIENVILSCMWGIILFGIKFVDVIMVIEGSSVL